MTRRALVLTLAFLTSAAFAQNVEAPRLKAFDPEPWLEDFHQLLSEMSSHYANLEWAVEDRKMDLPQLRRDTETKLREASNENDARQVVKAFLASFGDGHLEVTWPKPASKTETNPDPNTQSLCGRMGYKSNFRPGLDFSGWLEFSTLNTTEARDFPGGILRLRNGRVIGVIRIALFSEHGYPEVCEQAVRDLHLEQGAVCDDKCADKLEIATANLLTSALVREAEALRAAGATALLIDITHNGGGSDWADAPPRALCSIPLHDSKMAFIKHEHWTKQLQDNLRDIQADIKNHASSPISLESAAGTLEKAIEESKQACDRTTVWDTGRLSCSLLVKDLLFTAGDIVAYAKPRSLDALVSKTDLFYPSQYAYAENPNSLPLYVAVDRHTWSAAEYFGALLQDNHAATIVGEVTGGAGCGYTNGGIPTTLKNSRAQVEMPDCVRYRADGSNEVNGITPDMLIPWADHDSSFQRSKKLINALESVPAR
jgi:hypothetical protein